MLKQFSFLVFLFSSLMSLAQKYSLSGIIIDAKDNSALIGVNVLLINKNDTSQIKGVSTDVDGIFLFKDIERAEYILNISYVGYQTIVKNISVKDTLNFQTIALNEDSKVLKEVIIEEKQIRVQQLGDTSQFNASAFKVNTDATTEELLQKMPGITSDKGTVKVNGEEVKKVLIDGKPYFGDDPRTAVQNLPSDIIDKIQVFDRLSEQSLFTGFDDGNAQKTINIITKNGLTNSKFGRFYAGYGGPDNRYTVGFNYNAFKEDRRFSILAMSNNINQQNFAIQDLVGATGTGNSGQGGGRGGIGGMGRNNPINNFLVGQQNGIATTSAFGLNYADKIGKLNKVSIAGSYFFNGTKNENLSTSIRNYISSSDSGLVYNEQKDVISKNFNNRFNLRMEYVIDSFNTIIITPSLITQNFNASTLLDATNTKNNTNIEGTTQNKQQSSFFGINFTNDALYQHKFKKKGRTISVNLITNINTRKSKGSLYTLNTAADSLFTADTIDQNSTQKTLGYTIGGNTVYTEPVKQYGQISVNYAPSFTQTVSDKNTNNYDLSTDSYSLTDTALSNEFQNKYITNKLGVTYRYNKKKLSWSVGIAGQSALLRSEQLSPDNVLVDKHFLSLLPNAELNLRFSKTENLRIFYRSNNNAPAISQLQNVIDNSNSLILSSGNPDLKQNFSQTIGLRYSRANTDKATNFFLFFNATNTINFIANSTSIFSADTLINNFNATAGTQFIQPVNLNGFWNTRTFITYGFPITKIKCNMNINAGFVYTRTPTLINLFKNNSNSFALNAGFNLSSNISKKIDFTIAYNASYTLVRNTLQQQNNADFFNHTASAKINYQFWKGFVLNTAVIHSINAGGSTSFNTSYWLLNTSLAYKFLKDESLELKFSANDILNQNRNISRNVTEVYTEDIQSLALRRYFMGTITYTLKKNFAAPKVK